MAPTRTVEAEIDRLYQLPLEEFTAARNALAKQAAGDGPRVRSLVKPSVPAWLVNQLYWRDRPSWDALAAAAENARKVNRVVLAGKSGDVRAANTVHDEAIEAALKATIALAGRSGQPVTDATRQAIATTLRALPGEEPPGRLTKPIQPGGFEALAGLAVAAGPRRPDPPAQPEARERVREKHAEASAARELRDAEAAARHEEFEKARLEREARRAEETLEKAREALARATADLERAEQDARDAAHANKTAAERARKAQEALRRLRER